MGEQPGPVLKELTACPTRRHPASSWAQTEAGPLLSQTDELSQTFGIGSQGLWSHGVGTG